MVIALLGGSGTGKSTIENELCEHYGFKKVVTYTTRKPREGEVNGKDYYFISNNDFAEMVELNLFAEYDAYSQGRKYGTLVTDFNDGNRVIVITPNGLRQLKKNINIDIVAVLIKSSLGTRIKRYIDRIGAEKLTYDDKNEISARVERDYGMFLGIESECDLVVSNENDTNIKDVAANIIERIEGRNN